MMEILIRVSIYEKKLIDQKKTLTPLKDSRSRDDVRSIRGYLFWATINFLVTKNLKIDFFDRLSKYIPNFSTR